MSVGPGKSLAGPAGELQLVTNNEQLYRRAAAIPLPKERAWDVLRRMAAFWMWRRMRRWTWPLYIAAERISRQAGTVESTACMSNLDAAVGVAQIEALGRNTAVRKRNTAAMCEWLGALAHAHISDLSGMVLRLVIILPESGPTCEFLIEALADAGVEAQMGYRPLHRISANSKGDCPRTDAVWRRVICIPVDTPLPHTLPPIHLQATPH